MTEVHSKIGTLEQDTNGLVVDKQVHVAFQNNTIELLTPTNEVVMDTVDVKRNELEIEEPSPRERKKSIFQRYESKVPKRHKNLIANLVSTLMILSLWIIFAIPSIWLGWALADYFLEIIDPLVSLRVRTNV